MAAGAPKQIATTRCHGMNISAPAGSAPIDDRRHHNRETCRRPDLEIQVAEQLLQPHHLLARNSSIVPERARGLSPPLMPRQVRRQSFSSGDASLKSAGDGISQNRAHQNNATTRNDSSGRGG
jgi:hypothetical protein